MRRIVTFDHISASGYFAALDGNLDWVVPDPEIYKAAAGAMSHIDTMLFGRRTFEMFERAWRDAAADNSSTAANPHDGGRRSAEAREQAVWIKETSKVVFSRSIKEVTWKNSRLVHDLNRAEIDDMKRQGGGDMIIFGSGTIVSQLTEYRLVDEYQFVVSPVLLGDGLPLVRGVAASLRLDLLEARAFQSGIVMLRYAPSDGT